MSTEPIKRINQISDMDVFLKSPARRRIDTCIEKMSQLVVGYEVPHVGYKAGVPEIDELLNKLSQCESLVDEIAPLDTPQRFGNPSYRVWLERSKSVLNTGNKELDHYLTNSFGSSQRIDYGTGHELNFVAFWDGLLSTVEDPSKINGATILYVFSRYFELCRKVIGIYKLEPAGSHGVWGLDDHFHLPYILGAAQLSQLSPGEPPQPKDILDKVSLQTYKDINLYFGAINFIYEVKTGAFFEHSPMLYSISEVKSWAKILSGMKKMYNAEVLSKFPVVQHFYFGSMFKYEES